MYLLYMSAVPVETRRGHWIPWKWELQVAGRGSMCTGNRTSVHRKSRGLYLNLVFYCTDLQALCWCLIWKQDTVAPPSNATLLLSIARDFCTSICILGLYFYFHEKLLLEFHGNCIESNICAFITLNKLTSCVDCNLPVLINTHVFEPSYNDLKLTV